MRQMNEEYVVKIKDMRQDVTHTFHEWAESQNEANSKAMHYLQGAFGHSDFELVDRRPFNRKPRMATYISGMQDKVPYKKPDNNNLNIMNKYAAKQRGDNG